MKDKSLYLEVEDLKFESGNYFIREIKTKGMNPIYLKYSLNAENPINEIINVEFEPKVSFLARASKESKRNNKYITFDIETYQNEENVLIPYACGFYDGKKTFLYYLTDFNNFNEMLKVCLKDLIIKKNKNSTVYVHNLGKFDIAYIYKILEQNFKVTNLLPKDSGIISLTVSNKDSVERITLKFRDSFALLPSSLRELSESFGVTTKKGIFPYDFVNKNNLDFQGEYPEFKYFNLDNKFYLEYLNRKYEHKGEWSLKNSTLEYLSPAKQAGEWFNFFVSSYMWNG